MQIEYPSDIDEFNKILGTSEGKGNLLKGLGVILNNETRTFTAKNKLEKSAKITPENPVKSAKIASKKATKSVKKLTKEAKKSVKATNEDNVVTDKPIQINLFAGLFD